MDEDPFVSDDGAAPGSARGKLLLAGPLLLDPNFFRAVVLVLDHDDEGAFGLVVNRRSEIPLADVLAAWAPFARPDAYVYLGGPVAPEAGFALARAGSPDLSGVSPLRDGWAVVDLEADPLVVGPELTHLRIFSGYAGWGAGQLEAEMKQKAWLVQKPTRSMVKLDRLPKLWFDIMNSLGPWYKMLAAAPDDPSLN